MVNRRGLILSALLVVTSGIWLAPIDFAYSPKDGQSTHRFRLDPSRSKFIVRALAGGLLWFKGKDHFISAQEFSGEVEITEGSITPASMWLTVDANSLVETREIFTEKEKGIINQELREIVLEPSKYPEITFKSRAVTIKSTDANRYKTEIYGDLTLKGVTKPIVIPADVTLPEDELRASGKFEVDRDDFNVKATSTFHGLIRVRDKLEISFDIVGQRIK